MKYTYATLLLNETGAEINERNMAAVLEAAEADITTSRIKAIIAALEDVDISQYAMQAEAETPEVEAEDESGEPSEESELIFGADEGESEPEEEEAASDEQESDQSDRNEQ